MHVLQVTPRYFPNIGGVEIIVQKISEMLVASKEAQVTVYSVDLSQGLSRRQNVNGVLVKRFTSLLGDPLYFPEPRFITDLMREKADIIHVHNVHTLLPFLATLSKHSKQKLLLQSHYHRFGQSSFRHSLLKLYRYGLNSMIFSRVDLVIANSAYETKILYEDFHTYGKVALIPEGIDVDEVKRMRRSPVEPKRILYVGALKQYKNVDSILKGFGRLIAKDNKNFRLIIVGEGSEYKFLTNLAHSLGIENYVEWKHGLSRQQVLNEYAKASVLIMLSPLESFSRVVFEALLMGVPVVVLNYGATAHLVRKGFAEGVNSLNPEEIANSLMKTTIKIYPKIPEDPNTFLNWEEYSNKIINIYHRLLKR
jgi:glycosyltransferase involved in cell wall biosynthesis